MDEITLEEERTKHEVGVGPRFPGCPAWNGLEEEDRWTEFAVEEPLEKEKREGRCGVMEASEELLREVVDDCQKETDNK